MMELNVIQFAWLTGMSMFGSILGWINRRWGQPKSLNYGVNAIFTGLLVGYIGFGIVHHFTDDSSLSIMISGGLAYYSDYVLELGRKILDKKAAKL